MTPESLKRTLFRSWISCREIYSTGAVVLGIAGAPVHADLLGRPAGTLYVVETGSDNPEHLTVGAYKALQQATDIVSCSAGLETLENLISGKDLHGLDRDDLSADLPVQVRKALDLANAGRQVVLLCAGNPEPLAAVSAVEEMLEAHPHHWQETSLKIFPGVSLRQN